MTLMRTYSLTCDWPTGCDVSYGSARVAVGTVGELAHRLRAGAHARGWRRIDSHDYCPAHSTLATNHRLKETR